MDRKKVLVHLHLFYHEQLDYFIRKLKNICDCDWDLYVTVTQSVEKSEKKILKFKPDAKIMSVKNIGYDVWPFIQVLRAANIAEYDYVLKLHTKARYGTVLKNYIWRNKLVDGLLESKRQFRAVIDNLNKNNDIGLAATNSCIVKITGEVPEESYMLNDMLKRLNIEYSSSNSLENTTFVTGTMFIAKTCIFNKLIQSYLEESDFALSSSTGASGSNAHVIERMFTKLTADCGMKLLPTNTFNIRLKNFLRNIIKIQLISTNTQNAIRVYILSKYFTLNFKKINIELEGTMLVRRAFSPSDTIKHKRLAVFAGFCPDGRIRNSQIYYLKGLKEICDNVIFVADSKIFPEEIEKIKHLVCYCEFDRHNGYDFASYKIGYNYALKNGLLDSIEELILCNDSCYAPITSFENLTCIDSDFMGVTSHSKKFKYPKHIQSYFYVFKSKVFMSAHFKNFMDRIKPQSNIKKVIKKYELKFSRYLENKNFLSGTIVPEKTAEIPNEVNKTFYPLTLLKKYNVPLVKVKVFNNKYTGRLAENPYDVLEYIKTINPELAEIIKNENQM